ncbi:MAG: GNAT family N-acetyltransferase [Actinobacteria bacterium]|nr:GNAT family N-acetyltransferase [Actinomycetota bacterium]MBU1944607.1 GNAT family N-acetyltransferase [Actinomycetota bacterium]MBU2689160.1 GNAT family N-acetyltransferase [Actinomycetota bacterium]
MSALDTYMVRRFEPERDLAGACDAFVSGFHHILWPLIDHADRSLLEDMILTANHMSAATYVAEADGEARGILVGGLPFENRRAARMMGTGMSFLMRWFAGRNRAKATPFARACLRRVLVGYLPFTYRHPMSPSTETLMLTSQKEYRGGIGRVMMDAWVAESRALGYHKTTVGTDTTLSWDFYERYGFSRVREFNLTAYDYSLPGEEVTGYIYSLDI